jgi:hypothetical protein
MATKKMVTEVAADDEFAPKVVVIGPEDEWPIGLPDGTLVVRTET